VGKYHRVKRVGNHAYLYEITEQPIRRLSSDELTGQALASLLPQSRVAGQFFRVKRVGPYAYLYSVTERSIRPLTSFEMDTLSGMGGLS
jgi:hypothetical protein